MTFPLLQSGDTFAAGSSAAYGSSPSLWLRCEAWQGTDPLFAAGGTGYDIEHVVDAELCSSYFPTKTAASGPGPAIITNADSGDFSDVGTFLYRDAEEDECTVRARFRSVADNMDDLPEVSGVLYSGVWARVQNGSIVDSGDPAQERLQDVDGYLFVRTAKRANPNGYRFYLLRVNAGVVTRLSATHLDEPNPSGETDPYEDVEAGSPFEMELQVAGTGAQVTLTMRWRDWNVAAGVVPDWQTAIPTTLDTSGSRITAAGRAGFLMSKEAAATAVGSHARACTYITLEDGSGDLVFLEDWQRVNLNHTRSIGGLQSRSGFDLASGWTGDLHAATDLGEAMQRSGDRISTLPTDLPSTGQAFFLSQRPASNDRFQDREIDAQFDATTGTTDPSDGNRAIGIHLRGQISDIDGSPNRGYLCEIEETTHGGSGTYTANLYRYLEDSSRTLLASADVTASITQDADFVFRFEVADTTGIERGGNPAQMKAYLAGAQIVFVAASSGIGVEADSLGTVNDRASVRTESGPGEMIYVKNVDGDRPLEFLAWEEGPNAGGSVIDAIDQESVSVAGPQDNVSGTLSIPLGWPVRLVRKRFVHVQEYESNHKRVALADPFEQRTWEVRTEATTGAQKDALFTFWDAQNGPEIPFNWTTDEGEAVVVRFSGPRRRGKVRIRPVLVAPDVWEYEFELTEVPS